MASFRTWLLASRPKTLFAAAAPVLLGTAMALEAGGLHPVAAVLCFVSAILIQIATNFYNDAVDYEKGSDTQGRRGPPRATAAGLVSSREMKRAAALTFAAAVAAGGYLMWRGGWPIVLIGVLSILFGYLYTAGRRSLASLGVADFFVLVFFGPVAVAGTFYVQTLYVTPAVILAGLAPGALAVAILMVNNIRDFREDEASGKRTLVVRLGRAWGVRLYAVCLLIAAAVPLYLWARDPSRTLVLISVAALPVGLAALNQISRRDDGPLMNRMLARTAQVLMLYCALFAIGWNL